jgi:hypothetical protein
MHIDMESIDCFRVASSSMRECLAIMKRYNEINDIDIDTTPLSEFSRIHLQCLMYIKEYTRLVRRPEGIEDDKESIRVNEC